MSTWRGMNWETGRWITDVDHLAQSIQILALTPVGTRLQRREVGTLIPLLIDQPFNDLTRMKLMGAAAISLPEQEPRLAIESVSFSVDESDVLSGRVFLDLVGELTDSDQLAEISVQVKS